jgi:2-polyprenyl-6-methoxyphenol hydroxylase-like FAD-dependent oxidoreductase
MTAAPLVVIGGGIAGCAAAVTAAESGVPTTLIEASHRLGGVAVTGEHRTLCGLAPIDARTPTLLEPEATASWLPLLATGSPFRQGRVWLWPTAPAVMMDGLARRLRSAGVQLRMGERVVAAESASPGVQLRLEGGEVLRSAIVIDASGAGVLGRLLHQPWTSGSQWPAQRATVQVPELGTGTAARVAALRVAQAASGGDAALALVPIDMASSRWQLSVDVPPGTTSSAAAQIVERITAALGGSVLSLAVRVAERDEGRPASDYSVSQLFAEHERGLCWAAWPQEQHGPDGVTWSWPPADRHGVPEHLARIPGAPSQVWCVGKGMAVSAEAASALRVTGTCLALGDAVARRAIVSHPPDHAR